MATIEVRVAGKGSIRGDEVKPDDSVAATCDVCGNDREVTTSMNVGENEFFVCRECLRERLDASSVAAYRLKTPGTGGLPWGTNAG